MPNPFADTDDGKKLLVRPARRADAPLVLLHAFAEDGAELRAKCQQLGCPDFSLAVISGLNWDDELTPWPIPPIRLGEPPCGGQADAYLERLRQQLLPTVKAQLPTPPGRTLIAGYSLAGLFALYAACRCDEFAAVVSVSGSLWYPGLLDFLREQPLSAATQSVYLSLGNKEPQSRNPYLQTVGEGTRAIYELLKAGEREVTFEWNSGGHFKNPTGRLAKGINWALKALGQAES